MPESVSGCFDCSGQFDTWADRAAHFTRCTASGCEEAYCPSNDECPYCNGHGYSEDYYDDEEDYDTYDSSSGIYSYDYKPEPIWFGGPGAAYYLGFELEISAERFDTTPIANWCKNHGYDEMLYCKEDGSVEGFEIVSHPMTPDFFNSVDWESFFSMLEAHWPRGRYGEPDGHGLHVHVSRTAFPHTSTLARWSYLINRNQEDVNRVARRAFSHWARFTDYPVKMLLPYERSRMRSWFEEGPALPCGCCHSRVRVRETGARITRQFQDIGYPERYQAVNLTNHATVEVRVFKSTRKAEEFVSSLHFVMATVDFVRTMQPWHATRASLAWERFTEYVQSHPVFAKESAILTGSAIAEPVTV